MWANYYDEPIFKKLAEILKIRIQEIDKTPDYDNPNWSHLQAHRNGQRDALREVLALLPTENK